MKNVPRLAVLVVVLAMSVVAALPASAAPDRAPDLQYQVIGQHTVKQGEWLYCIGRAYQVSPWAIAEQNHIPWPYWVYPNQVLQIPAVPWYNIPAGQTCAPQFTAPTWPTPTPPPPTAVPPTPGPVTPTPVPGQCRVWHNVLWGQTLSGIAWYYGTTIQAIMYANPSITNPNLIYAGSTLCIP
jgi:LysM repeat protein